MLLVVLGSGYTDSQVFADVLDSYFLVVFEGVQHGRVGKRDLPFVLEAEVFPLDFVAATLFQVEFAVSVFVGEISALLWLYWQVFDHLGKAVG